MNPCSLRHPTPSLTHWSLPRLDPYPLSLTPSPSLAKPSLTPLPPSCLVPVLFLYRLSLLPPETWGLTLKPCVSFCLYYLSILSMYCAMMNLKSRFQYLIKFILKSFLFFIHSIKQGIIQKLTYIIIPPNTAHTLKIKLDENPLGKIRFFVE